MITIEPVKCEECKHLVIRYTEHGRRMKDYCLHYECVITDEILERCEE